MSSELPTHGPRWVYRFVPFHPVTRRVAIEPPPHRITPDDLHHQPKRYYANDEQKRIAAAYIAQLDKAHVFSRPIVTRLESLPAFYPAEEHHQDFAVLHPSYAYIVFNDLPKVENLKRLFADVYRDMPVTVLASSKPTQ